MRHGRLRDLHVNFPELDNCAQASVTDYHSTAEITNVLDKNKVDVLISTVFSAQSNDAELALIGAAHKASHKIRFIPSSWGVPYTESMGAIFPPAANKIQALEVLEKTSLVYSSVHTGYFLDYFCLPKVESYMDHVAAFIDIANDFAAVPGSGNVPVAFTHTWDIAQFVAAYVEKPASEWEKDVFIIGDKVTMNGFVRIAEEAKQTEFTVVFDSLEKLASWEVTELPSHPSLYPYFPKPMLQGLIAAFRTLFANRDFDLKPTRTLNQVFPHIKARTVKEAVYAAWRKEGNN